MHELHQTIAANELKNNARRAFALAEKGPVVIISRAKPKAVLVAPDEWNRIARRLEILESLLEAQRIEARNDADDSWVSSIEMRDRLMKRGVDVGSSL
ncbi:MAG TPA: type II toxin-antitoxin system Phd/YefM family antitoxin [Chloroflexi bacterium]|nr:type II toxin-antitoxin system Phd/YefM family antitoxin [Chloroflexota bacterium]